MPLSEANTAPAVSGLRPSALVEPHTRTQLPARAAGEKKSPIGRKPVAPPPLLPLTATRPLSLPHATLTVPFASEWGTTKQSRTSTRPVSGEATPSSVPTTRPAPSGRRVYASAAAKRTSGDTRTAAGVGEGGPVEGGGGVVVGAIVVPWGCGERAGGRNESVCIRGEGEGETRRPFFFLSFLRFLFFLRTSHGVPLPPGLLVLRAGHASGCAW